MDTDVLEEKIKVANNRIQKLEDKVDSQIGRASCRERV